MSDAKNSTEAQNDPSLGWQKLELDIFTITSVFCIVVLVVLATITECKARPRWCFKPRVTAQQTDTEEVFSDPPAEPRPSADDGSHATTVAAGTMPMRTIFPLQIDAAEGSDGEIYIVEPDEDESIYVTPPRRYSAAPPPRPPPLSRTPSLPRTPPPTPVEGIFIPYLPDGSISQPVRLKMKTGKKKERPIMQ